MIIPFLAALYCLADLFLLLRFKTRLRPAHLALLARPASFWSSGKGLILPFFLGCAALWMFPLLAAAVILFSKWPHPFWTAWSDLRQKPVAVSFPSAKPPKGKRLFEINTADRPHILFVMLESFRAKNVGCLGAKEPLSPHFDRLAKKGILFTRFHSTGNLTNRAILASLFGVPAAHRPWHLGHYCKLSFIGLPQILAQHGYHSALIQGGATSFDHEAEFFGKQGFQTIFGKRDIDKPGTSWGVYDEYLMPFAAEWLAKQQSQTFLNLLTITNHHPWIAPNKKGYLRTFAYTDEALGLLIEELRQRNLLEKSLLFIFGDHGQEADEINRHLYQDSVHVPLLIYGEGRVHPLQIDTVASQLDLLPTVLDVMGISAPHRSLGKSLLRPSAAPIYFSHPFDTPIRGCRQGHWKYLIHEEGEELYDLRVDPEETENRIGQGPSLKAETLAYFEALDRFYSAAPPSKEKSALHFDFSHSLITDAELETWARQHPDLASLSLAHCLLITDAGIAALLAHCPKLEKLEIDGLDEITGAGWGPAPHLVHLKAFHCPNLQIDWVRRLPSLMVLQLGSAEFSDTDLQSLPQQHLTALSLSRLYRITNEGLRPLLQTNPHLMILSVDDCPHISSDVLGSRKLRYQFIHNQ